MARTHTFKGSASGWGYFAYIEDGQLVIGEDWDREGGILYKGPYSCADVDKHMLMLSRKAPKLYNSIITYYAGQAGKEVAALAKAREEKEPNKEPYYIRYRFKDSRDSRGNGYSGYISVYGELVLEYDDPRNGGEYYRGSYDSATSHLEELKLKDRVLYNDIEKYFAIREREANEKKPKVKYQFQDSRDSYGNGYSGYLDENYDLVLVYNVSCYHDVYYRGPYATAGHQLGELRSRDKVLYDDIEKYFTKHGVKDESDRKDLGGSKETKYTVRLLLNNSKEIVAVIPGTSETDVIRKIMLPVPDTVMLYDLEGRAMAVRSDKIYTVTILD